MNTARFSILVKDLPLNIVLDVIDALEDSGFYPAHGGDWSEALNAARAFCQPAPSPAALSRPERPEAPA